MENPMLKITPKVSPVLDKNFRPAALENRAFKNAVLESKDAQSLKISIERAGGLTSNYKMKIFSENSKMYEMNFFYVERIVKSLLWARGGWKITIGGLKGVGEYIKKAYSKGGIREFDADFMSRVYEKPFTVQITDIENVADEKTEEIKSIGGNWDGCRIGFDAGGSDRKVSAVIDGKAVFSEEVVWHPKIQSDPEYHYSEILKAMKTAASHLPRVDAIGVSSAGVYIDNRAMVASLFLKIPEELFDEKIKDIYINIANEMGGVPIEVANDGDVTALVGAMSLNDNNVLGIAMGTSEAGGYVDGNGNIKGWLNELAFIPVDYNTNSMVDEWSGDFGCGVKYFSQDAVIKLAPAAGIKLDEKLTPAEKLKIVQDLHAKGDKGAIEIFETIGCYLGYTIAHYADFYDIKHVLILGRVTSGEGGKIMLNVAMDVMNKEFPELAEKIQIHLPDEKNRRVGQSVMAASLPKIK